MSASVKGFGCRAGAGRRRWLVVGGLRVGLIGGRGRGEQVPDPGDVDGPRSAGEQAVVADAVEVVGQDMQQEAADELVRREGHGLDPRASRRAGPGAVVLPAERHAAVVEGEEPAVRDRDPMGVAGQIGEHRLGSREGPLGVDHPLRAAQRSEMGREGGRVGERRQIAVKGEPPGAMRSGEPVQEQPAEQAGEDAHGQEEAWSARDPARAVRSEPAAGHHDVHMRVVGERRSPGVQHGGEADPGAEVPRVGRDREERVGSCAEQQVVDHGLVLECQGRDRRRQGEHDVIVGHGQRDMAAERRRAAGPDRTHDLELAAAQVPAIMRDVGVTIRVQDFRDLQLRPRHERRGASRRWRGHQQRERACDLADRLERRPGIDSGGVELPVPEQHLDHPDIGLALQEMRREAVAERVHRDALVELGGSRGGVTGAVELTRGDRLGGLLAGEEPVARPLYEPPLSQEIEQVGREHDIAVLAALALLDPDQHAGAVDVCDFEVGDL